MGLINLRTDLKSLRYGKDTLGGGYSGQPYIQTPIPDGFNDLGARHDFILRGGANTARDSATDIKRLAKMFGDLKSPNGVLFIAKQQVLSQTAVRTQTSGVLNEGIYTPLSTLEEAGVVALGGHLNKQGNPFAETGAYANNRSLYFTRVKPNPNDPEGSTLTNRLVNLYNTKQIVKANSNPNNNNVLIYRGGPGAPLGVGNTFIRFADQRTGINNALIAANPYVLNPTLNPNQDYFYGRNNKVVTPGDYLKSFDAGGDGDPVFNVGVTGKYFRLTDIKIVSPYNNLGQLGPYYNFNVYNSTLTGWYQTTPLVNANNTFTYNQKDLFTPFAETESDPTNNVGKIAGSPKIQDFRAILRNRLGNLKQNGKTASESGATPFSLDYTNRGNIEQRVNLGDPGQRANKSYANYAKGVTSLITTESIYSNSNIKNLGSFNPGLDKINSLPIYRDKEATTDPITNDLVKFRIAIIDNDSPTFKTFMHFRAFLGPVSDAYNATWNGFNYLGRGEQFFTYGGFTRQISLSWIVAAQSKEELIPMYKKLNYLASTLTPDYSPNGYMRGNLAQLTIGGYLYEQPGIITSLTYEMGEDSPWEIGIGANTDEQTDEQDGTVKELAHIIRVSGFSFTPIHNFIPSKQNLTFSPNTTPGTINDIGFTQIYGYQRFISLANGVTEKNSNYNQLDTSTTQSKA